MMPRPILRLARVCFFDLLQGIMVRIDNVIQKPNCQMDHGTQSRIVDPRVAYKMSNVDRPEVTRFIGQQRLLPAWICSLHQTNGRYWILPVNGVKKQKARIARPPCRINNGSRTRDGHSDA